jgi:hypothetical protein
VVRRAAQWRAGDASRHCAVSVPQTVLGRDGASSSTSKNPLIGTTPRIVEESRPCAAR